MQKGITQERRCDGVLFQSIVISAIATKCQGFQVCSGKLPDRVQFSRTNKMIDIRQIQFENPRYLLALDWPCKHILLTVIAVFVIGVAYFLAATYTNGEFKNEHWFLIVLTAFFALLLLLPSTWRPWVTFAADKRGIYLGGADSTAYFVPWERVGETDTGTYRNKRCVKFQWKANEIDMQQLVIKTDHDLRCSLHWNDPRAICSVETLQCLWKNTVVQACNLFSSYTLKPNDVV